MSVQIEMPQLSSEGESATLASWLVEQGAVVEKGEVIAELETDKATVELESPASGTIDALLVEAGTEDVAPGTILGTISGSAPETTPVPSEGDADSADSDDSATRAASESSSPAEIAEASDRRGSTPLARRVAAERGIDLATLEGSGAGGRVVEADVLRAAGETPSPPASAPAVEAAEQAAPEAEVPLEASSPASVPVSEGPGAPEISLDAPFEARRLSAMRKTIARRLTESKQQVPHFYLRMRCPMDAVLDARVRLNAGLEEEGRETRLSLNDFILRAAALALRDVPEANVSFAGKAMHHYERVDISVAVATEGGLVTPVVREADRKGLTALAEEVKELAALARASRLRPDQYQGGTFTISNLGMYGIETVYPILNPPQACILGVGAAEEQPVVRDGEIGIGRIAAITLAADHRAVDGAVGARLMAALRERLEDPLGMML